MSNHKICLLGSAKSIHLIRWANSLANEGYDIHLITMTGYEKELFNKKIQIYKLHFPPPFGYYLNSIYLNKLLNLIKPDLVNVHYASGYGTLIRLTPKRFPVLLSVWGSDIYEFPNKSKYNLYTLKKNLSYSDFIASTSLDMKDETSKYISDKKIFITPFGIDTNKFISLHSKHSNKIVIGTVKTMKDIYGIPYLIRAFAQLIKEDKTNQPIELLLIGGGNQINEYKKMVRDLNIEHLTHFTGQINHDDVPEYLNKLDIYCAPSESESFGVAILEASSCELPVIVSDVGGLPEVVDDKVTGYIIEKGNVEEMKIRLINLIENPDLRVSMGKNGRNKVVESYDWEKSVEIMKHVYRECIEEGKNL